MSASRFALPTDISADMSDSAWLLFGIIGFVAIIIAYYVLWHTFRLFEKWFLGTEREGFFESMESAQDAKWWFRRQKASPPAEPWKPDTDFHIESHQEDDSVVLCKGCGRPLLRAQIDLRLGNPEYNEWCREGFCTLACFEKHRDEKSRDSRSGDPCDARNGGLA